MKHLERYAHDVTNLTTEIWCSADGWSRAGVTDDTAAADCVDCLEAAVDFGEDARHRLAELRAAQAEPPPCDCRAGAHPARANYLQGQAERLGPVCKLGWPL